MGEIKDIPKGWQRKKLGEMCKLKNGFAFKSDKYQTVGVPVIRISDINGGIVSSQKAVRVKANEEYENYLVEDNDILVAMSGATTGKFGIYKSTEKAYQNQRVGKFKILDEKVLHNEFLFHQINSLKRQIEKDAYGGAQPNISSNKIEQMQIVVPPLPDQQAIVAKIEALLSELENGKQQLLTAQQQLKMYRQSLLKWLYDKSVESVPVKLVDVCDFITKGTTPSKDKLFSIKGDVPFLKVYNLTFNGTIDFSKDPTFVANETHNVFLKRSIVYPNDVLMNIVGPPLGKVSIVPSTFPEWNINQAMVRLRCKENLFNKYLLYFLLCENTIRTYSRKAKATAGQFNLTLEICRDIEIPLPSIKEQKIIVEELESKLTVCDKIEETISQSLQQAETLRQSILKKAFSGELVQNQVNP